MDSPVAPPSSFDQLRMRATEASFQILILSLSKDEDLVQRTLQVSGSGSVICLKRWRPADDPERNSLWLLPLGPDQVGEDSARRRSPRPISRLTGRDASRKRRGRRRLFV